MCGSGFFFFCFPEKHVVTLLLPDSPSGGALFSPLRSEKRFGTKIPIQGDFSRFLPNSRNQPCDCGFDPYFPWRHWAGSFFSESISLFKRTLASKNALGRKPRQWLSIFSVSLRKYLTFDPYFPWPHFVKKSHPLLADGIFFTKMVGRVGIEPTSAFRLLLNRQAHYHSAPPRN